MRYKTVQCNNTCQIQKSYKVSLPSSSSRPASKDLSSACDTVEGTLRCTVAVLPLVAAAAPQRKGLCVFIMANIFEKWVDWCNQRHSNPVSGPISEVVNFLAHLFKERYQYCSLNAYCSAITSVHEKMDGYKVGQHPLVSRLLKGAFNQ